MQKENELYQSPSVLLSLHFPSSLLSPFFFPVFSNQRIYFVEKPNCPEFAYPWLMESPGFLKPKKKKEKKKEKKKKVKKKREREERTWMENVKFVRRMAVNIRRVK